MWLIQCTRWQITGRPGRYTNTGHRRDQFDECACLSEISSFRVPSACRRSNRRMTRRSPGNTTGWFAQVQHVTWVSWPEREVIHSVTVRRRSATSMTLTRHCGRAAIGSESGANCFCWCDATKATKPDDPWSSFVSVRVPLWRQWLLHGWTCRGPSTP